MKTSTIEIPYERDYETPMYIENPTIEQKEQIQNEINRLLRFLEELDEDN